MTEPVLVAVAHGTRSQRGQAEIAALIERVRRLRPDLDVRLCWLDIAHPSLAETLTVTTGPAVVVPVLLSTGYHVTRDIPDVVRARPDTVVARHLGPDAKIVQAVADRLVEARTTDGGAAIPIVLVAAGSSDEAARAELRRAGDLLSMLTDRPVAIGQLTTADAFAEAAPDAEVANYMLASGHFADKLRSEAERRPGSCDPVVARPLADHPLVAELILDRFTEAATRLHPQRSEHPARTR